LRREPLETRKAGGGGDVGGVSLLGTINGCEQGTRYLGLAAHSLIGHCGVPAAVPPSHHGLNRPNSPSSLDEPLRGVVLALAEALERTEPELVDVAVMWLDVIADFRRLDDAALCAILAHRLFAQLVSSDASPASRGVPLVPLRRSAADAHGSTYHPPADVPVRRRAVRRTDGRTHQDTTHAPIAKCSRLISAGKA
jgi:hypothetical protein